jgi:hypothetical protein
MKKAFHPPGRQARTGCGLFLAMILLYAPLCFADVSPLQKRVTLQFTSIDVYVVLAQLANDVGLALIHDHLGTTPRATIDARDEPAAKVVEDVTRQCHLRYTVCGRALIVGAPRMIAQYRDTTSFVVPYKTLKPEEAARIVQGVFPYVEAKPANGQVKYVVPRVNLDRVRDIAQSLESASAPAKPTP